MTHEQVVLCDDAGHAIGVAEKLDAHRDGGRLHLAFSILVHDGGGRWLLQRRADCKYHFAGRWSNTCCGHPRPGETVDEAAVRRLGEEFGFEASLSERARFIYRAEDPESGLTEHELLQVLEGRFDGEPNPDPSEIGAWRWIDEADLKREMDETPDRFTPWFREIMRRLR